MSTELLKYLVTVPKRVRYLRAASLQSPLDVGCRYHRTGASRTVRDGNSSWAVTRTVVLLYEAHRTIVDLCPG